MTANELVLCEKHDGIVVEAFNRPNVFNVLNRDLNRQFIEIMSDVQTDTEVRVIILTGVGTQAFIAGGDIKEVANLDAIGAREYAIRAKRAVDAIYYCSKPVIAAINGLCLGGGLEYAMACDFRVASERKVRAT